MESPISGTAMVTLSAAGKDGLNARTDSSPGGLGTGAARATAAAAKTEYFRSPGPESEAPTMSTLGPVTPAPRRVLALPARDAQPRKASVAISSLPRVESERKTREPTKVRRSV